MPIFQENNGELKKLKSFAIDKEKKLQELVEKNLMEVLDMHFLETEYTTTFGGRIDTLAVDTNGAPVIIEYKRNKNDNVINQSLSYLKWLQAQKVEFFEMLVFKKLGSIFTETMKIDWQNPRVICIAESYSKFDIDTVEIIPIRIELFKYRYYENDIFSLEPLNTSEQKSSGKTTTENSLKSPIDYSVDQHLLKPTEKIKEIFHELRSRIFAIDENIKEKATSLYIGYRVTKTFAEIHLGKNQIKMYLRPIDYNDPKKIVEKIPDGYNWTLNQRIYVKNIEELDYVFGLIEQSYQDVL
jgi:predicted transport protein